MHTGNGFRSGNVVDTILEASVEDLLAGIRIVVLQELPDTACLKALLEAILVYQWTFSSIAVSFSKMSLERASDPQLCRMLWLLRLPRSSLLTKVALSHGLNRVCY